MNLLKVVLAALAMALVVGTTAHAEDKSAAVALKGYDVVAYFKESRARKGTPEHSQDFDGMRYYFSSAQNRGIFSADPDRFTPQFRGHCTLGVSKGKKFEADPTVWKIVDGKLYVFSSPKAADAVDQDPAILERAHQAWDELK